MTPRLRRVATHPITLVLVAAVMLYTLAGFTLVPWLVARYAPRLVAEHTGHALAIEDVQANPYLLRLEARGLALRAPDGTTVASVGRLLADLHAASLVSRVWRFDVLLVEQPVVNVVRREDGRLNLADLAARDAAPQATPPQSPAERRAPPPIVVEDGAVAGGRLTYADHTRPGDPALALDPIDIDVYDVATVPDQEGRYALTAALPDGARLAWRGDVSLQPLRSEGEITLEGLQAKTLWPFLQGQLALETLEGAVAASTHYTVSRADDGLALTLDAGRVALTGIAAALPGAEAGRLRLANARAEGIRFDLRERMVAIARLALDDGAIDAHVDAEGRFDWAGAVRARAEPAPPASGAPWRVRIDETRLAGIAADYTDASRKLPLAAQARLEAAAAAITAEIGGATRVAVENLDATLAADVRTRGDEAPLLALPHVRIADGRVDTRERLVRANGVEVEGGRVLLQRDASGVLRLAQAFAADDAGAIRREVEAAAEAARADARPWRHALDALRVTGVEIAYRDAGFQPPFEYAVSIDEATLRGIAGDAKTPVRFDAALRAGAGGTVQASGEAAQDFSRVQAKVVANTLALAPAQPWLDRYARLALAAGTLSATADLAYRGGDAPAIEASGALDIAGLRIDEQGSGERFLAWKTLAARDVRYASSPGRLAIREVRVVEPGAKIVIARDRSVNVAQVLRERPAAPPAKDPQPGPPFAVDVQRVALAGGTVDFADLSLVLPFATTVRSLDGTVLGISTDRSKRAEVKAGGRIADYGAARVAGSVRPFAPTQYTDLRVEFENVAMPPLSPYTATFAGRTIEAGRLWLDLHYRIEDRQLLGENEIRLADVKLGERVEAPNALDLPLDLALAVLADSQGRIRLSVPVRGDLGNPQFSYATVIREALGNVIGRIVSAPFRALGALAGGRDGGAPPDRIEFAAGEAEIEPPEREKLDRIAGVLRERPGLALVVPQPFDPASDTAALRVDAARRALTERLGRALPAGEDPGPIDYGDADTQRELERMLGERLGEGALARFAADYQRTTGRAAQRVNPVLGAFGRGSEDRDFYTALFERIVATQPLPDDAAQRLAAERAQRIARYLTTEAGLDAARVRTGDLREAGGRDGEIAAELRLATLDRG